MTRTKEDKSLKISIGKLWNGGEGTVEKLSLDLPVEFDDPELKTKSNLRADVMLIKLKNEISAIVSGAEITLNARCAKCLETCSLKIEIPEAEREFLGDKKFFKKDTHENFHIDFGDMTIDLKEMIRQEIFLHFPLISVCSKSCKGICPSCGQNLNLNKCDCPPKDTRVNKPFKDLKKLMSK